MEPQDKPFKVGEVVWHREFGKYIMLDGSAEIGWNAHDVMGRHLIVSELQFLRSLPPIPKGFKRKVKKEVKTWVNVYRGDNWDACVAQCSHSTKKSADRSAEGLPRIACVELTGTYEVEEDVT